VEHCHRINNLDSQGRLVGRLRSTRRVELWDDNFVIPPLSPPCWSGLPTIMSGEKLSFAAILQKQS
jgi:hypothetical protein